MVGTAPGGAAHLLSLLPAESGDIFVRLFLKGVEGCLIPVRHGSDLQLGNGGLRVQPLQIRIGIFRPKPALQCLKGSCIDGQFSLHQTDSSVLPVCLLLHLFCSLLFTGDHAGAYLRFPKNGPQELQHAAALNIIQIA